MVLIVTYETAFEILPVFRRHVLIEGTNGKKPVGRNVGQSMFTEVFSGAYRLPGADASAEQGREIFRYVIQYNGFGFDFRCLVKTS